MDKVVVLHHSKFDISSSINANDSFAGHTHMLNLKSELPNAHFISFIYLEEKKILVGIDNLAPWFFSKWISLFARLFYTIHIFFKYDKIIIYHSEGFYYFFPIFMLFKNKAILQVNEVYSNVVPNKTKLFFELNYINSFKKIIASNIWLKENWLANNNVIVRGGYFRFQKKQKEAERQDNSFIYVGSVDEVKMGNLTMLKKLIETVPNYIDLYLCLLTSDEIYELLKRLIVDKPQVRLFRNVKDNDLNGYYQKCKYGLVLQDSNKPFNLSSFPSKIFSYVNNGVTPVAQKNYSLMHSEVCDLFCFIEEWSWDSILRNKTSVVESEPLAEKLKEELNNFIYSHKN